VPLASLSLNHMCGHPGSSGSVFKVTYKGKDAAAKKFLDSMLPVLQREIKSLQLLAHSNIVRMLAVMTGVNNQPVGFIMDYMPLSLDEAMKHMTSRQAVHVLSEAAIGIAVAHDARVIHSDIKPANILCSQDFTSVKIADFGLAHVVSASQSKVSTLRGTPLFIAPELAEDDPQPTVSSDMFSFGMTAWQVLCAAAAARACFA
jgi:serine/threonine-protein kinase